MSRRASFLALLLCAIIEFMVIQILANVDVSHASDGLAAGIGEAGSDMWQGSVSGRFSVTTTTIQ